jgi:hypothetical protein
MGIYYYAVDTSAKEYFTAPAGWAIKSPGIYHPENPFPGMVIMMNIYGSAFEIWNDGADDIPPGSDYKDVTEKVFVEYLKIWPKPYKD